MTTLATLRSEISIEERLQLLNGTLPVSAYNRATLMRLIEDSSDEEIIASRDVEDLRSALQAYLNTYMAEQPEYHKWIILSCLYLNLLREPLHPKEVVGWRRDGDNYYCSAREDGDSSLCHWCVCKKMP